MLHYTLQDLRFRYLSAKVVINFETSKLSYGFSKKV